MNTDEIIFIYNFLKSIKIDIYVIFTLPNAPLFCGLKM